MYVKYVIHENTKHVVNTYFFNRWQTVPGSGDGNAICHPSKMMVLNQSNFPRTTAGFRFDLNRAWPGQNRRPGD